jgi:hypothetical protein
MFCPQCGFDQPDELRFCKSCGANLSAVRAAVSKPDSVEKFDWSKTWVAEMLMSGEESVRRAAEIERLQGITPEIKRRNEIKAGVITGSVGIGLMILLYVLMQGIIESGRVSEAAAAILSRLWVAGIIPIFVGLALIVNGVFVSKRSKHVAEDPSAGPREILSGGGQQYLPPADTNELFPAGFSVTDETTRNLAKDPRERPS